MLPVFPAVPAMSLIVLYKNIEKNNGCPLRRQGFRRLMTQI